MSVMKDKLEKTHHKGSYYAMKKISIAFLAVMTFAFVVAVPTYIINSTKKNSSARAEENSASLVEDKSSDENSEYETYND